MTARNILLFLLDFLGLGAIFGGAVLIISPSDKLFQMPLSLLSNSPFTNFLIPGVILFSTVGLVPVCLIFALIKKPENKFIERINFFRDMYWAWSFCIYTAFTLIIWIQSEMYFLQAVHWSHSLYMLIALTIIFIALLPQVRNLYKNEI
ncbi:hypothetical protein BH10BAC2_BH10BAC2_36310 [soil metagenome]